MMIRQFMPRGLFVRSLLILITPIILVLAITSFVFVDNHWNRLSDRLAETVAGEIAWLSDMVETSRWSYTDIQSYGRTHLELGLTLHKNESLPAPYKDHGSWERIIRKSLIRALDKKTSREYRIDISNYKEALSIKVQLDSGVLTFEVPSRRVFSSSTYIFLIWMIFSGLLLVTIASIFMRNQIRPIRSLAKAAENYGKGIEVDDNFKAYGAREVRQAAHAFIEMQNRISRQISQRTIMLAGVSHDLRTPLTRLKLSLSMLSETDDIKEMKDDITDMEHMIDGYLDFARGADEKEKTSEIEINDFLKTLCTKNKALNQTKIESSEPLYFKGRKNALERAITNILNNASKYGQNIWVTVNKIDDPYAPYIEINIDDDGPGIREDLLNDVFKPFYRVDSSRNSKTGGVGLGLSIAQDIILNHGGKINLGKSFHKGLNVCIHLPI